MDMGSIIEPILADDWTVLLFYSRKLLISSLGSESDYPN